MGQSITQRGSETRDTVGIKTLTGERQEDPLEGTQRRMDGSRTRSRFFVMIDRGVSVPRTPCVLLAGRNAAFIKVAEKL